MSEDPKSYLIERKMASEVEVGDVLINPVTSTWHKVAAASTKPGVYIRETRIVFTDYDENRQRRWIQVGSDEPVEHLPERPEP